MLGKAIASLFVRVGLDSTDLKRGTASAKGEVTGLKSAMSNVGPIADMMSNALKSAGVAGAAYLAIEVGKAAFELGKLGLQAKDVERNLVAFAGSEARAAQFAAAVVKSSGRGVDSLTAMSTASRFLQMGLVDDADAMRIYIEGATRLGDQTQTTNQRIEGMTQLLKNQSVEMLDNYGLSRSRIEALRDEAMATQGLTREEAMLYAIKTEIIRQLELLGPRMESGTVSIDRMSASWMNLKTKIGEVMAEPTAEFADELSGGIDNVLLLYNLLDLAISKQISAEDALRIAMHSKVVASNEGVDAANEYVAAALGEAGVAGYVASVHGEWTLATDQTTASARNLIAVLATGPSAMAAYGKGMRALAIETRTFRDAIDDLGKVTVDDLISGLPGAAGGLDSQLLGIFGDVPSSQLSAWRDEYVAEITAFYEDTKEALDRGDEVTEWSIALGTQAIEDKYRDRINAVKESGKDLRNAVDAQQEIWDDMRSAVQSALSPTSVTAEDMGLAAIDKYVDKWDEAARQLDAIAERGFAELDAHPDWAGMLKIPPDVMAAGEEAMKSWARRTADSVRNLERIDLLDMDTVLQTIQDEINRTAARELTLDIITQAALDKGMVTGADAKDQVAEALGLKQALPVRLSISDEDKESFTAGIGTVPVRATLSFGEEEEEAEDLDVSSLTKGAKAQWDEGVRGVPWMQTLSAAVEADIKANKARLTALGTSIGAPIWDGLLDRLRGSGIVNHIIQKVLESLGKETK